MSRVLGAVLAIALAGAPAVAIAHHRGAATTPPRLVELTSCRSDTAGRNDAASSAPDDINLAVSVPRVAIVHIGVGGRVVAALTNTGCAPRRGDTVYVANVDGSVTISTALRVDRMRWTGDFTKIGTLQTQRASERNSD